MPFCCFVMRRLIWFYSLWMRPACWCCQQPSNCHSGDREQPRPSHIIVIETGHEIISMAILSLPPADWQMNPNPCYNELCYKRGSGVHCTFIFCMLSIYMYRRWTEVSVTMAYMQFFKTESRNSFTIYSRYVNRHDVTGSVQVGGLFQCLFLGFSIVCICLHSKQARVNEDGPKRKRTNTRGITDHGRLIPARQKC